MTLPTFVNPFSEVLHTELYTLTAPNWLSFMWAYIGPPDNFLVWVEPYASNFGVEPPQWLTYNSFAYTFYLDTVRTYTITSTGLQVEDNQVTSRFDLVVTGPGSTTLSYSFTRAEWAAQAAVFLAANPGFAGSVGAIPQIPQLYPPALATGSALTDGYLGSFSGYPTTADTTNDINAVTITGTVIPGIAVPGTGAPVYEIAPLGLAAPVLNQGGTVNVQQGAYVVLQDGADTFGYPAAINSGNSSNQPFGLICDRPNVSLGTLVCKAVNNAVCPAIPVITVKPGQEGVVYSSAAADVSNWAGFRYLKFNARVNDFPSGQVLPRMLFGIVPQHNLTEQVFQDALDGDPSLGLWYELAVTEQGTGGQSVIVDLACPIKGSGTWCSVSGLTYTPQYALGTGMFPVNPVTLAAGSGSDVDSAVVVVCFEI